MRGGGVCEKMSRARLQSLYNASFSRPAQIVPFSYASYKYDHGVVIVFCCCCCLSRRNDEQRRKLIFLWLLVLETDEICPVSLILPSLPIWIILFFHKGHCIISQIKILYIFFATNCTKNIAKNLCRISLENTRRVRKVKKGKKTPDAPRTKIDKQGWLPKFSSNYLDCYGDCVPWWTVWLIEFISSVFRGVIPSPSPPYKCLSNTRNPSIFQPPTTEKVVSSGEGMFVSPVQNMCPVPSSILRRSTDCSIVPPRLQHFVQYLRLGQRSNAFQERVHRSLKSQSIQSPSTV